VHHVITFIHHMETLGSLMAKKRNIRRRTPKNSQERGSEAPSKNGTKTTPSDTAPTSAWWKGAAIPVVILARNG
jgi:hypothetical protein